MIVLKHPHAYQDFKAHPNNTISNFNVIQKSKPTPKIDPIRVLRQSLTKAIDIKKKLGVKAYKHVFKVGAVGSKTIESLCYIQNAKHVKTIRHFEFDPYLCDDSCLPELAMTYPRLKNIFQLTLIIKRMNKQDSMAKNRLVFNKFKRLTKIKASLVYNGETYECSAVSYVKEVSKCYWLKSLTFYSIDNAFGSNKAYEYFSNIRRNFIRLEEFNTTKYINYAELTNYSSTPLTDSLFRLNRIRRFNFSLGNMPGWIQLCDEAKLSFVYLTNITKTPFVEDISFKFLRYPSILDFILAFVEMFPLLSKLKKLKLNLLKSPLGNIEILELCRHIHKLVSLKQFTLKVYQYPNLSAEAIKLLVKHLVDHPSIEVFDIYTRRLDIPSDQIDNLISIIEIKPNVECARFKQTLHIFKRKN